MKGKLTKGMKKAAQLLADGRGVYEVAHDVGCNVETLYEWMRDPRVMEMYQEGVLRTKVMSYARAVTSVQRMMGDENPTVAQRAVHEALDQFGDAASQLSGRELVVRVEGMLDIGMPPEVGHEET